MESREMTRTRRRAGMPAVLALGVLSLAMVVPGWLRRPAPVEQPLAFSHATHVKGEEIRCKDCHEGEDRAQAGFPPVKSCGDCHSEPEGEHPDEPKVREYLKEKREIPWVAVTRNAGHVYFSHRVHVRLAGLGCEDCHGLVEDWTEPPRFPVPNLVSMDACIDCHEEKGATLDCQACHQ